MLQEGDKVPAFTGVDQNEKKQSLKEYKGKKLAMYFYPKDMTETCTIQACNIRDNFSALKKHGISIIGISPDKPASHKKFENKYALPFPLIADTDLSIINEFGVWGEKQTFGKQYMGLIRTTFLINEKGIIHKVIIKPKSKFHAQEIIEGFQK